MPYPSVTLTTPLEVQAPVNVSSLSILQVVENPSEQTVQAFVDFGVNTQWVSIMDPSNYNTNWTDSDVADAINNWAVNNFPPAR